MRRHCVNKLECTEKGIEHLGMGVVQVFFSTLIPGCVPVNAAVALGVQLPSDGSSERGLFASPPLPIYIAHGQVHLWPHMHSLGS